MSAAEKAHVLVCAAVVGAFVGGYLSAPEREYPLCVDDSGASEHAVCVWDAGARGDGNGTPFVSLNGGETIVYPDGQIVE